MARPEKKVYRLDIKLPADLPAPSLSQLTQSVWAAWWKAHYPQAHPGFIPARPVRMRQHWFSRNSAELRKAALEKWGCEVTVVPGRIVWEDEVLF